MDSLFPLATTTLFLLGFHRRRNHYALDAGLSSLSRYAGQRGSQEDARGHRSAHLSLVYSSHALGIILRDCPLVTEPLDGQRCWCRVEENLTRYNEGFRDRHCRCGGSHGLDSVGLVGGRVLGIDLCQSPSLGALCTSIYRVV